VNSGTQLREMQKPELLHLLWKHQAMYGA